MKLSDYYEGLDEISKEILHFLAIYHEKIDEKDLIALIVKMWGGGTSQEKISLLEKRLKEIKKTNVVKVSGKWLVLSDTYKNVLLYKAVEDESWRKTARLVINVKYPFGGGYYYDLSKPRFVRELRFSFYTGDVSLYSDCINKFRFQTVESNFWEDFYKDLSEYVFSSEWLGKMPFEMINLVIFHKNLEIQKGLSGGIKEVIQILKELVLMRHGDYNLKAEMLYPMLLAGDFNGIRGVVAELPVRHEKFLYAAIISEIEGRSSQAAPLFEEALKLYRKKIGSKTKFFPGFSMAFYILNGFRIKGISFVEEAASIPAKSFVWGTVEHTLEVLILHFSNKKREAVSRLNELSIKYDFQKFAWFLASTWTNQDVKVSHHVLITLFEQCKNAGLAWIAWELSAILKKSGAGNKETDTFYERFIKEQGANTPLIQTIVEPENWELALMKLEKIADKISGKESVPVAKTTRLTWQIKIDSRFISIEPVEQVFGKNGWSSGKAVALKRLLSGGVKSMTSQDFAVAECIEEQYANSGWYYKTTLGINVDNAMPLLVDHPLLFLDNSSGTPLQLVKAKPSLQISVQQKGYLVSLTKYTYSNEHIGILKETPTRYVVVKFDSEYRNVLKAFDDHEVLFPLNTKEQLLAVAGKLATIVEIHSPLLAESENIPEVVADSRLHLHLLPVGEGFQAETFVKPFVTVSPYFKPGEGEALVIGNPGDIRSKTRRDFKLEKAALKELLENTEILKSVKSKHGIWNLESAENCLQMLVQLEPLVKEERIFIEWPKGEKFRIKKVAGMNDFFLRVSSRQDWFSVDGELKIDETSVLSMQSVLAHVEQSDSSFMMLSQGQYLALTDEFKRRLKEISGFVHQQKGSMVIHPFAGTALEEVFENFQNFKTDKKWKENIARFEANKNKVYTLPDNLETELRPYQVTGYEWLCRLSEWGVGACLADDMGLGKTIQALALLLSRANLGPALVVAPASVVRNWVSETQRFAPSLRPLIYGEGDRSDAIRNATENDLIVCTYSLLQRDAKKFKEKKFATIILDEAQAIKNRTTKRSASAMDLQGDFKMVATGTPIENHLGELWNLFNFINPGLLGTYDYFAEKFSVPIEKIKDTDKKEQLKKIIQPFVLRRLKNDVLKELPDKTEIVLSVEFSPEERAFYEALRRTALAALESNDETGGTKHLKILAEITKLRLACCHPQLVTPDIPLHSSKLALFGNIVEELLENNHKALVFSQFVKHLNIVKNYLDKKGISYQYLDGSIPLKKRQESIDAFQSGTGDIFLISLKAGGSGLNLTAADYVIHLDPWWNPAVEDQASDRAHRIGQEKPVTVYRLVTAGSIEEKILRLHEQKRDLADSLLSGTDISARLSADDLLELIRSQD